MRKKFEKQPEVYRRIEWINVVLTHTLLVLMMGCVGLVISQVMRRLAPDWPSGALPGLCVLIALEALLSWYITRRASDLDVSPITSLMIEWVVLLILMRLFLSLLGGLGRLVQDIRLACFGLDHHDNDFVIGLLGRELVPLSACVQAMRGTRQTSQYMQQMGPFFIGRTLWQSPLRP